MINSNLGIPFPHLCAPAGNGAARRCASIIRRKQRRKCIGSEIIRKPRTLESKAPPECYTF